MMALHPDDRRLIEQVSQGLQSVAALMRGLLASQPRPEPPGDWGRGPAAAPTLAPPSALRRVPDPPRSVDEPLEQERRGARRRHTEESIAADRRQLLGWMKESGLTVNQLCAKAAIAPSGPYRAIRGHGGLSAHDRATIEKVIARLRIQRVQKPTNPNRGATR